MSNYAIGPENQDDNQIIAERRSKLTALRTQGNAYPNDVTRSHFAQSLQEKYAHKDRETLEAEQINVTVAGRMMLKRVMGKASFATLQDGSGRLQVYLASQELDTTSYEAFKHWDIGDIIAAQGTLFLTKTGELTVRVQNIRLLAKNLRPLPEKYHGLTDQEQRYRQRYVDLIMNEETRAVFTKRSHIIQSLRHFMVSEHYLEVETPMMHPIPGGATAKPFVTYHNTLDMPLYLRVAPELYLKRLIVGGFERVFEINRNFRNEGISTRHNPEFTMIEFYEAYSNYHRMMEITESAIQSVAQHSCGSLAISYQGKPVNLSRFERLTMLGAIKKFHPEYTDIQLNDIDWLQHELKRLGNPPPPSADSLGTLHLALFEATTETLLWDPTFIIDYPVEVSPLARASDTQPGVTERFELFCVGRELANGYSELNDPEDQAARFMAQAKLKASGDEEAMHYDADYVRALEYAMPPTGGCGIGIDRLVMLLTDSASIRDVILFPQMRIE